MPFLVNFPQDLIDAFRGLVTLEVEKNWEGDKIKTTLQMVGNRQGGIIQTGTQVFAI